MRYTTTHALLRSLAAVALIASTTLSPLQVAAADDGARAFVDKRYELSGDWQVIEQDGRTLIRFGESFRTQGGPDLKVFLSPLTIDEASGDNATEGALLLGALSDTAGTQDYALPEGTTLDDFQSVLVHCEAYSVLWGGGAL